MSRSSSSGAGCILALISLLVAPFSTVWKGYVLVILWGWFIVPVFHIPVINIPEGIGLSIVVSYLTHQMPTTKKDEDEETPYAMYGKPQLAYVQSIFAPELPLRDGKTVEDYVRIGEQEAAAEQQ